MVLEVDPFLSAGLYMGPVRISHSTSLQQPYWGMRSLTLILHWTPKNIYQVYGFLNFVL